MKIGRLQRAIKNLENRPPNHGFWAGLKSLSRVSGLPVYKLFWRILSCKIGSLNKDADLLIIKALGDTDRSAMNEIEKALNENSPSMIYIKTSFNSSAQYLYFPYAYELLEKHNYSLYNFYSIRRNPLGQFISAYALFINPEARKKF